MEALKFLIYNSQSQWKIKPSVVDKNLILIPGEIYWHLNEQISSPFLPISEAPAFTNYHLVCLCVCVYEMVFIF